jgi:hypothetical protein
LQRVLRENGPAGAKKFDWFDIKKLEGMIELSGHILSMNKDMEKERIEKVCACIESRIHSFNGIIEARETQKRGQKKGRKLSGYDMGW